MDSSNPDSGLYAGKQACRLMDCVLVAMEGFEVPYVDLILKWWSTSDSSVSFLWGDEGIINYSLGRAWAPID
jgi:hypothetical protein